MVPTRLMFTRIAALMYAYINALVTAPGWNAVLIDQPFVPGPDLVYADLSIDNGFEGAPQALLAGLNIQGTNPVQGGSIVCFVAPSSFQYWIANSITVRTVYGMAWVEDGGTFVYASQLFDTPITITRVGDVVRHPQMGLTFPVDMFVSA